MVFAWAAVLTVTARKASADSVNTPQALLSYLGRPLQWNEVSVRVYYEGVCRGDDAKNNAHVVFPRIDVTPLNDDEKGLDSLIDVIGNRDVDISFSLDLDTMYVRIGHPSYDLLKTKINVRLDPTSQYNPIEATKHLVTSRSLRAAQARLAMRDDSDLALVDHLLTLPTARAPHLPATIKDQTLDQALDAIVRTFKGAVFYGTCTTPSGEKWFDVVFLGESAP